MCRMKPEYMGPESPVKMEFKEFCASNAMDSKHLPCSYMPTISNTSMQCKSSLHRRLGS